jgi:hypothetical protein
MTLDLTKYAKYLKRLTPRELTVSVIRDIMEMHGLKISPEKAALAVSIIHEHRDQVRAKNVSDLLQDPRILNVLDGLVETTETGNSANPVVLSAKCPGCKLVFALTPHPEIGDKAK